MDYYTKKEYYFSSKDEMRAAMGWFRDNKVANWYHIPRLLSAPVSFYIIAHFNYTETDKMMIAELKFG